MNIKLSGTLPCSFVNGIGARYVVFTQGCTHHCEGCHNPDTWDPKGGYEMRTEALAAEIINSMAIHPLDGLTISGGDPFDQYRATLELVETLRFLKPKIDIWIYTGYEFDEISETRLARLANVVVTGPFEADRKVEGRWYGSANQEIWHREENSWRLYGEEERTVYDE